MPEKKRGGGQPVTALGHIEEARIIAGFDGAFDVQTLLDNQQALADLVVRRHARDTADDRALCALVRQNHAALTNLQDSLQRLTSHAHQALRIEGAA